MAASANAQEARRLIMICNACGSEDVRLDAWAEWDVTNQRWKLAETFDSAFCNSCEGETGISTHTR